MSRTADCFACRTEFATPVLHESTRWRTVVNRNQDLLGKTFIVLRRHEEEVARLTEGEWSELLAEVRWVTDRVRAAFEPDHFNYAFLMNVDRHVHLHVIPRYVESRTVAGVEFVDADYPSAYRVPPASTETAPPSVIAAVHDAIAGGSAGRG
ncbi:MAG: HIT family protein [Thermoleophilia bacterium]|nr:HIT family protein [Thermoleophilia bacterium]